MKGYGPLSKYTINDESFESNEEKKGSFEVQMLISLYLQKHHLKC